MANPLPAGPYDLILSDPPWRFESWSPKGEGRSASTHYQTQETNSILDLPVAESAAPNSVLLLWATWPLLEAALETVRAWGFDYKTAGLVWVKRYRSGGPFVGMGYFTRSNTEPCLLATRGDGLPRADAGVSQIIESWEDFPPLVLESAPREHSRKPDGQYDAIELLFGGTVGMGEQQRPLRRLELYARQAWPRWDRWGNQAPEAERPQLALSGADGGVRE